MKLSSIDVDAHFWIRASGMRVLKALGISLRLLAFSFLVGLLRALGVCLRVLCMFIPWLGVILKL